MKIKNVRTAKSLLCFTIAAEMLITQDYISSYDGKESLNLKQPIFGDSKGVSRKLSKRKNNPKFNSTNYSRKARNSLRKPNYYDKTRDF